jgi:large subunit ribosomal protein L9
VGLKLFSQYQVIFVLFCSNQTTFVLKRRYPPLLDKQNRPPKPLVTKNFVYDEVENANLKKEPDLKLILTSFVEGIIGFCLLLFNNN